MLDGLRTCTHNACLLSCFAVVFAIGLQLTIVRLVIWFHLQNVECTSRHSPSSFPEFLLGCLRKPVSRYPAVTTVQAQIVQGNQVPKSCPVCWWRSSLADAAVWSALCRSVVFQVIFWKFHVKSKWSRLPLHCNDLNDSSWHPVILCVSTAEVWRRHSGRCSASRGRAEDVNSVSECLWRCRCMWNWLGLFEQWKKPWLVVWYRGLYYPVI